MGKIVNTCFILNFLSSFGEKPTQAIDIFLKNVRKSFSIANRFRYMKHKISDKIQYHSRGSHHCTCYACMGPFALYTHVSNTVYFNSSRYLSGGESIQVNERWRKNKEKNDVVTLLHVLAHKIMTL